MYRSFLFISLCSLIFSPIFSQGPQLPSAPGATAMSYSKYADIFPNLYNGALSVPISLYNISEGPLSHDVGIQYHTAGIRVNELSSEIGLGWSGTYGGLVTLRRRGLGDIKDESTPETDIFHKKSYLG